MVITPGSGDAYTLIRVLPNDELISYARSREFSANVVRGSLDVTDLAAIAEMQPELEQEAKATEDRLFDQIGDADLNRLGVDDNTRTIARLLASLPAGRCRR